MGDGLGLAKPNSGSFVRNSGVSQTDGKPLRREAGFLFWGILDKSLSNVIPQMSLVMCVAVFNYFSFLRFYFLFESTPSLVA